MSIEALRELRAMISRSPELQQRARPYMVNQIDKYFMVDLGKQHGLDFTVDEVDQEYFEVMSQPDRELSDFELELVAGGTGPPGGPTTLPNNPADYKP